MGLQRGHPHLLHRFGQVSVKLLPVGRITDAVVQVERLLDGLGVTQCLELLSLCRQLLGLLGEGSLKLLPPGLKLGRQFVGVELPAVEGLSLLRLRSYLCLCLDFCLRGCVSSTLGSRCGGLLGGSGFVSKLGASRITECCEHLFVGPLIGTVESGSTQLLLGC
jgi:hypothetical protein